MKRTLLLIIVGTILCLPSLAQTGGEKADFSVAATRKCSVSVTNVPYGKARPADFPPQFGKGDIFLLVKLVGPGVSAINKFDMLDGETITLKYGNSSSAAVAAFAPEKTSPKGMNFLFVIPKEEMSFTLKVKELKPVNFKAHKEIFAECSN